MKKRFFFTYWITLYLITFSSTLTYGRGGRYEVEHNIHFRINRSVVDTGYLHNKNGLAAIEELLRNQSNYGKLTGVVLIASSSPEGRSEYNLRLARKRSEAMYKYLCGNFSELNEIPFQTQIEQEWWQTFIERTSTDAQIMKYRPLSQQIESTRSEYSRNVILKKLTPPALKRWVEKNHLAPMRYVRVLFTFENDSIAPSLLVQEELVEPILTDSLPQVKIAELSGAEETLIAPIKSYEVAKPSIDRWAIKTNLLYDALTVVNIEAECALSPRWSLSGEWIFPWWLSEQNQRCLQLLSGNLSLKYWLGKRTYGNLLRGWSVGVFTGGGLYDLEWDRKGYQGEFFISTGLSVGYAHAISRDLYLEYSLQGGLFTTNYRRYQAEQDPQGDWHLSRQETGRYSWVGPTGIKISLGWNPASLFRKGGRR